jgi:hypothetical protein
MKMGDISDETNGMGGGAENPYNILSQWYSKLARLRVVHVGAGAVGLLMADKM